MKNANDNAKYYKVSYDKNVFLAKVTPSVVVNDFHKGGGIYLHLVKGEAKVDTVFHVVNAVYCKMAGKKNPILSALDEDFLGFLERYCESGREEDLSIVESSLMDDLCIVYAPTSNGWAKVCQSKEVEAFGKIFYEAKKKTQFILHCETKEIDLKEKTNWFSDTRLSLLTYYTAVKNRKLASDGEVEIEQVDAYYR